MGGCGWFSPAAHSLSLMPAGWLAGWLFFFFADVPERYLQRNDQGLSNDGGLGGGLGSAMHATPMSKLTSGCLTLPGPGLSLALLRQQLAAM